MKKNKTDQDEEEEEEEQEEEQEECDSGAKERPPSRLRIAYGTFSLSTREINYSEWVWEPPPFPCPIKICRSSQPTIPN